MEKFFSGYCDCDQINEDEMPRVRDTHRRDEEYTQRFILKGRRQKDIWMTWA
jgi:hypothetical protein